MSADGSCSQTPSRAIPAICHVVLGEGMQLPPAQGIQHDRPPAAWSSAPPLGGTRVIYHRKFLMECRNLPVTKTPPRDQPAVPGVISSASDDPPPQKPTRAICAIVQKISGVGGEEAQFEMDI
ncbi:hypothetical protein H8958_019996 [Nasalis larvatus]